MSDPYHTEDPPQSPSDVPEYLSRELRRIESAIQRLAESQTVVTITSTAVASTAQNVVIDCSATAVVFFLNGVGTSGREFFVKRINGGLNKAIVRASDGTIDGVTSATLSAQYQSLHVISDGTTWLKK